MGSSDCCTNPRLPSSIIEPKSSSLHALILDDLHPALLMSPHPFHLTPPSPFTLHAPASSPLTGGSTEAPPSSLVSEHKGQLTKEIRGMMYGFGDDANPRDETVDLVEVRGAWGMMLRSSQ